MELGKHPSDVKSFTNLPPVEWGKIEGKGTIRQTKRLNTEAHWMWRTQPFSEETFVMKVERRAGVIGVKSSIHK